MTIYGILLVCVAKQPLYVTLGVHLELYTHVYTTSVIVLRYSSKSCLVKMVVTQCGQTLWIANENTVVKPHSYTEGEEGEGNAYHEPEPTTSLLCPHRSLWNVTLNFSECSVTTDHLLWLPESVTLISGFLVSFPHCMLQLLECWNDRASCELQWRMVWQWHEWDSAIT